MRVGEEREGGEGQCTCVVLVCRGEDRERNGRVCVLCPCVYRGEEREGEEEHCMTIVCCVGVSVCVCVCVGGGGGGGGGAEEKGGEEGSGKETTQHGMHVPLSTLSLSSPSFLSPASTSMLT